jgi:antitoxin PrlF
LKITSNAERRIKKAELVSNPTSLAFTLASGGHLQSGGKKGLVIDFAPSLSERLRMKMTDKGQVTIPPAMRRKHGLLPRGEVKFVDQPNGVLVVKAGKLSRGDRVLAALLRGGRVKGNTESWLRLTRGTA